MATKARQDKIWFFDVTDPQLHPNGFTIYRVTCKVFLINSPESLTETIVWKRYNDFKQLFKAMFSLHRALHRRDKFPEFAKPKVFGRFEESVIEERRQSALRLLRFISEQPHLSNSNVLQKFLEGGKILPASTFHCEAKSILTPNKVDLLSSGVHSTGEPPDILQTVTITDSTSVSGSSTSRQHSTTSISTNDTTGTLDVHSKSLEGTWNFPQIPDNISLGSSTGEDTDFESSFGTPLKDSDLAVFDPILSNDFSDLIKTRDWLNVNYKQEVVDNESIKEERGDTLTKDSSSNSRTSSVRTSIENLLDSSHHGHGDATLDLGEFDPLRERSVSGIECGKGDIDLSNSNNRTSSVNSQMSLPSTPKSGHSTPRCQSPAVKKRSNTNTSVSSLTQTKGDYLVVAASQIGLAQECESNGNYEMAFAYYKIGVDVLIQGVQGDTDRYRQDAVRRKTAQYLLRAEEIYNNNLSKESLDDFRWAASSCISPNLDLDPSFALIRGSLCELRNYKVLGTIDSVILVMDKLSDETFVIKTVHKSSAVLEQKTCLLPTSSPYMCNLLKFFETENAVYLLLQYASGGKLWNYIGAYLHGRTNSGFDDGLVGGDGTETKNVYTGQQFTTNSITDISSSNVKVDNVLIIEDTEPKTKFNASEPISFTALQNKEISSDTQEVTSFDDTIEDVVKSDVPKRKKRLSSFSSAELTFDESDTVVKPTTDDQFDDILNKNNQSLQYFTINSFDSNSDVYQRMDSNTSTSEHIPSIPEEIPTIDDIASTVSPTHDDVFDCDQSIEQDADDIIRSSKALMKSVDRVLSDSDRVFDKDDKSKRLSNPESNANVSHDSEEASIYDLHKPSDDSSETSEGVDSKRVSAELVQDSTTTDLSAIDTSKVGDKDGSEYCNKSNDGLEYRDQSKDSETVISSSPQYKADSGDINTSLQMGRKRTLSRMNSKTLTRSASFECDLKSPSKNRARAVSNLFDRLDCVEPEQVRLLESCIRQWASEIVVAVSKLHHVGIICRDLNPNNILLGDNGHIMLTYFSRLPQTDEVINQEAAEDLYVAPEVLSVNGFDETCDWWSLGALLYELLVGQTLLMCHPGGINSHTNLYVPSHVSQEGQGLLQELLRFNPKERLGSSLDGVEAIKSHPFFNGIDWNAIEGS